VTRSDHLSADACVACELYPVLSGLPDHVQIKGWCMYYAMPHDVNCMYGACSSLCHKSILQRLQFLCIYWHEVHCAFPASWAACVVSLCKTCSQPEDFLWSHVAAGKHCLCAVTDRCSWRCIIDSVLVQHCCRQCIRAMKCIMMLAWSLIVTTSYVDHVPLSCLVGRQQHV
jgi:hypothetical protein